MEGVRVLVVEDEYFIADDFRRELSAAGAVIVGPASSFSTAAKKIDEGAFDCAVIDLNLHGESALPLAARLATRGKPFAIATGYGSAAIPPEFKGVPRIEKPFDPPALLQLVAQLSRG
ncbi:MAG: response regulator, partial [Sphingomonas sp.]|nr:response regulator [Sphingomonas sp.]